MPTGAARRSMRFRGLAAALTAAALLSGCAREERLASQHDPDATPDAFARPTAALMWPGVQRAFLIDEHGELSNGLWRVRVGAAAQGRSAPGPRRIAYEDRWLPIAHWTRRASEVRWDFEAVAFPARSDADSVLAVSLRFEVENLGSSSVSVDADVRFEPLGERPAFVSADGEAPAPGEFAWARRGDVARGLGWNADARLPATLAAGKRARGRMLLSSHPLSPAEFQAIASIPHASRAKTVRTYWNRLVERGAAFALNDPETENAVRAAVAILLACRARAGDDWIPIGGPFHYRDTWLRDGARLIHALAIAGHVDAARSAALGLRSLQWPTGAFMSQRGQLDGSGQALWAFEQAFLRPAAGEGLREVAASAVRAWGWAESQRALGRQAGWRYSAMLPFAEPRDNELVRAQLVGNDAWMLAGYRSASRLCSAAGLATEAARIDSSRRRYEADFLEALSRTGATDVPPSWQGGGRDWGNMAVAWPTAALHWADSRCEVTARRIWAAAWDSKLTTYGSADTLQNYVGADLGIWAMLAGHPEAADSVLASTLEWRNAAGSGAELFSRSRRDFGNNLPPHPTSAAALVTLVRSAIVHDDSDTLRLTLAARRTWWKGAHVRRAPTRWGDLDLSFRHEGSESRWEWSPVPVWTVLRLPPGTTLASSPAAPLVGAAGSRTVLAPPGTRAARVIVTGAAAE